MPLTPAATRQIKHQRRITCDGFLREDGLWDIEAHLTDCKSYTFANRYRGEIQAGEFLHNMSLRLTLDDNLLIHKIEAVTDDAPFASCPEVEQRFQALQGKRIIPGWRRQVQKHLGGVKGCTHLVDLLSVAATIAYQTVQPKAPQNNNPPALLNSCHAFSANSEVVKVQWPEHYRAKKTP
ncbi:MAG: DUF2889 domain-containing protein [Gammaproteobacteria bacterium]|nr:DUF2889 domain-containing protein [Gammaproteobacteria bacterium]